jgi:hypothetical protein
MEVSGQLHAHARFTPGETVPGTHWICGWARPRAGLDTMDDIKIPAPVASINCTQICCEDVHWLGNSLTNFDYDGSHTVYTAACKR